MEWITPKHGGKSAASGIEWKFAVSNHANDPGKKQGAISISEAVMRELRWVIGDRLTFAVDKEIVHIKRVPKDGFVISSTGNIKHSDALGKMLKGVVKTSGFNFPIEQTVYVKDFIIQDNIVIFSFKE